MKLLLDTHIWLWRELEPKRISRAAAAALEATENELWLSPLSVWELAQLVRRGRISLTKPWPEWVSDCLQRTDYREAAVGNGVVGAAAAIELSQGDPMDWLLAATARHYGLRLVTADERLLAGRGFERLPV